MKPTLLLLAAGMGSRYGGLKQLDGVGPNGETIMDYSIYDAIKAGFGKIVFVFGKILSRISVSGFLPNMKGTYRQNWCFRVLTHCPKALLVQKAGRSLGVRITLL